MPESREQRDAADRAQGLLDGLRVRDAALAAVDDALAADEIARAAIARTAWIDRVRALDPGTVIEVELPDGRVITGAVASVLADGLVVDEGSGAWVIRADAIASVTGLGTRTREGNRVEQRLGVTSVMREWAQEATPVQCMSARGMREGTITRVGADHIDIAEHERDEPRAVRRVRTIPMGSVWALRRW